MKEPEPPKSTERTPLDRMADLTRRIVAVKKTELRKPKQRKPKRP